MFMKLVSATDGALLPSAWPSADETRAAPVRAGAGAVDGVQPFAGLVGAFLLLALARGGSSADLVAGGLVTLCAIPLLAIACWRFLHVDRARGVVWPVVLVTGVFALALVQLAPAPPALWSSLPGRDAVVRGYAAAGLPLPWLPMSLTPDETRAAAMGFIAPLSVFASFMTLNPRSRLCLAGVAVLGAIASMLLGMAQLAGGVQSPLRFYEMTDVQAAVGFFANRNHQGALLGLALPLLAAITVAGAALRGPRAVIGCVIAGTLIVGAAAAMSRAGAVVAVLGLLGALAVVIRRGGPILARGLGGAAATAGLAGLVAVGLFLAFTSTGLADRFAAGIDGDLRRRLVPEVIEAGAAFAPFGSGLGSFRTIFPMFEPVERISGVFINHVHNDYAEIWLESGWPGLALVAAFVVWWARRTWEIVRSGRGEEQALALAGALVVLLLLGHSAVDYPLRTPALAALFGCACGLMLPARVTRSSGQSPAAGTTINPLPECSPTALAG
jgi:O-antigen ligase